MLNKNKNNINQVVFTKTNKVDITDEKALTKSIHTLDRWIEISLMHETMALYSDDSLDKNTLGIINQIKKDKYRFIPISYEGYYLKEE